MLEFCVVFGVGPTFQSVIVLSAAGGCVQIRVPDPEVRYIAFGDSATSNGSMRPYPDILADRLGEPSEAIANEGESGESTEEGLTRLEALLSNEIFPNAEVLLYWEGGNDITEFIKAHDPFLLLSPDDPDYPFADALTQRLDEAQGNIESAIVTASNAGLDVYVATYYFLREEVGECDPLPLDLLLPPQAQRANAYLLRLNQRIREAVVNQEAILVDVGAENEVIGADPDNYVDCNHLSERGNSIVAELFFEAITASTD
ncbi:MAG: SGNH/GDSL hydrolase family protein [Phycisphaerae bacterium]